MPSLGNLWYQLGVKDMTDADLQKIQKKLENLGFKIDATKLRQQIEAGIGATPFNATVTFGNARASIDAALANTKGQVTVEVIASKLKNSIDGILAKHSTEALVKPKKKELRKAVSDALLSAGFEINIGKAKGVSLAVKNALGTAHDLKLNVDSVKLADSIDKALGKVKGKAVSVEARKKILTDSITNALKTEKFPIKVIVDKAEAQYAVRQALQAAGLQNSGFTASDKRAWDAQSRRMEAQARVAAQNALAQRRLAGAHNAAQRATDSHIHSSISLGSAMRGNIRIAGELGPMLASAYSVVALKNFMQKVVEIGGELEQQKLAMKAILGDEGMANTISSQINSLAVKSPFGVMELNQYAKQLTAFQIPYNELYDTMKRMADVSAAVGVDMGRIILAYGQVRAAKFLKGTELRQFTEANIPMIDMLAQRFTKLKGEMVSAGDVMDMISNKEVTFEDVKAVLWELTGEGGRFYNMQEVLSESVKAKWKNLADAVDLMFASIAESTSSPLKSLAEILTELTRNWKTIASVVASGAIAFGLVKTASLLTARSLDTSGTSALKSAANAALLERQNARLAQGYRMLTRDERKALQTSLPITSLWGRQKALLASLSGAQFRQLALTGQITKEEWSRMIALGRLNDVQKKILVQTGVFTQTELGRVRVLNRSLRTLEGWKRAFLGVGNACRSLGRSMLALVANPMTLLMAAVGTVTALWQRNSEEMQRAEEIGKNVATSASEGARNLKESLETIKPGEGLSDTQLTQGIEQMQQLIKDYSPTPITDINDALVAQDGHVRTLIEQYEELRKKLHGLSESYSVAMNENYGDVIKTALKASNGWFDEGLEQNAKDYTNSLQKAADNITEFLLDNKNKLAKHVQAVADYKEEYAAELSKYATVEAKMRAIIEHPEIFGEWSFGAYKTQNIANRSGIKSDLETLEADIERVANALKANGIDPQKLSDAQKQALAIQLKNTIDQLEDTGEEAKAVIAAKWEEAFGMVGMIIEDKIGPSMQEKFRAIVGASTDEGVKMAARKLQYEGYNALSAAEKETVKKLMEQAKGQTMADLGILNSNMQNYLTAHPLTQLITLAFASDKPSELATELVKKHGYPGLTESTNRYVTSWTSDNSVYNARNAAQSALQAANNELDAAKKAGAGVEAAQKKWDEVWAALEYLGWTDLQTKDQKYNKHTGSGTQKDPLAESLKQRFKDIKDAWSEFQKWSKTEGREAAAARIGESGLFSTLPKDKIPQTVEQYRALVVELENELRKAGVKGNARESLLNDLLRQLLDIDKTVVDEQLKLALDKVTKEAERQLENWNLYDKVRKATGNKKLAKSIAFGMNADATTDYPTLVRKQFNDLAKELGHDITFDNTTLEQAKKLGDDIAKSYQDTASKLEKYAREQKDAIADILNEYQSLQDKLRKIDADRDRKIDTVNKSDMPDADKAKYIQRINVEADYQKFTQSNEYLQFFAGIYALTQQEATRIGDLIEQNLNRRLQAGTISAEDYYKEIERVRQQLSKLRNVKSDAMTFMTGGVKGLNQKKQEENDAKRLETIQKIKDLEEKLAEQKAAVKGIDDVNGHAAVMQTEAQLMTAKKELSIQDKIREKLIQNQQTWQNVLDVANIAANIAGGLSDAFNSIRDMADAFGVDTESGAWEDIAAVMDTLTAVTEGVQKVVQSAMNGDIGGILSGVVSTITSPFTIWSKLHDKKLQKLIDRSKEAAQIMQNQYDILEKRMANFLGNAANMKVEGYSGEGGAYDKQRQLMQGQLAELEKQRQAEIDKKKTDDSVVEDYNKQIEEMKISIRDFALEAAKDIYGIDLNRWAEQLGDSLVDAFAKGEDAAEAFDKTVGDILRDVTSKMISQDILAPMFGDLRDFLFGENGMSGVFGADFKLDASEVAAMKEYLDKIKNQGIPAAEELFNAINSATGGLLDDTDKAKSGLSAGIQSVTEDTADLLASYVNAIRASAAMNETRWERLLNDSIPQMNVIAQSQLDAQRQIAENTLRNAIAAEAIVKSNDDISRLLVKVTQGGAKFYVQ